MPSMLVLRLAGAIPDVAPRWLLGAASAVCELGVGEAPTPARPFSVGAVVPVVVEDARVPVASWRLGWLEDDAPPPGWPPAEVRFGSRARTVLAAELHRRSYAELAQGTPARHVRLTMTTPTFFTLDGRDLPLPDPALMIRGLLARWNSYAPGPLRIGADDARALVDAIYLDGMWGASADVELGHGLRQTGFVGQADLRLLAATSDYIATMFTALTRFAAYAGVGARTAYGFGAVDVDVVDVVDVPVPRRQAAVATSSGGPRRAGALTSTCPPRLANFPLT
jgi:CRISPR-associated endoribonuclease Cas6